MIDKKIEDITKEDLIELINNKVQENKTLDYKSKLSIGQDGEKKEFLAEKYICKYYYIPKNLSISSINFLASTVTLFS